ncbi:MAG TPA: DNA methyltransferase, partial [Chthoniobacterales bacterium]
DYIERLKPADRPRFLVTCDFHLFEVENLQNGEITSFHLNEIRDHAEALGFLAGYEPKRPVEAAPVNLAAVERLGELYDAMKDGGYPDHDLQEFLVRILFCLFAEDTGVFEPEAFSDLIANRTSEDGSDLGAKLDHAFQTLDAQLTERQRALDEALAILPYVNGALFTKRLTMAAMDSKMREALIRCTEFDWSKISPAIFGSLFQGVMDAQERRAAGAHYTSEENILKLVRPLFLDTLQAEFTAIKTSPKGGREARLKAFHQKLATLKFFDPACGCGNFLIIAYRELRRLEIEVLKELHPNRQGVLDVALLSRLNVDQFYGIEIDEFPAQIAKVALWLMDHVMNVELGYAFGRAFTRLPLTKTAHITCGNALKIDWETVISPEECSYILGNPPFVGKQLMSPQQDADMKGVCSAIKGNGLLDFVAAWYVKACEYIKGKGIACAFVSTNSITQGEQVGILWNHLFSHYRIKITFAHRTFVWKSEARGKAHVHVVIIGFANSAPTGKKTIFDYPDPKAGPIVIQVNNISPYLIEGGDYALNGSRKPLCSVPPAIYGSKPADDGALIIEEADHDTFLNDYPHAAPFVKPLLCTRQLLYDKERWCLWLVDAQPRDILSAGIKDRVQACRVFRLASPKAPTKAKASEAHLFAEIRQPKNQFILIPQHTSENRNYIPFEFFSADNIVHNSCTFIPDPSLYHFGVISSEMHMAWIKTVCGRLESRYRYSGTLVYNNFPWPEKVTDDQEADIAAKAQEIIDLREKHSSSTLAELYNPLATPPDLAKAHIALDRAVERAYRKTPFTSDRERVEYLFSLYEKLSVPLARSTKPKRARKT